MISIKDVYVYPQGIGAIFAEQKGNDVLNSDRFVIIDIGGGTTEYIAFIDENLDHERCDSFPEGTINFAAQIKTQIFLEQGIVISEKDIESVMLDKKVLLNTRFQNMIKGFYRLKALELIERLKILKMDSRAWPVFLTGGGAQFVKDYFIPENNVARVFVQNDIRSNAIGFENILNGTL